MTQAPRTVVTVAPRRSEAWARAMLDSRWRRVRRIELLGVPLWVFVVRPGPGRDTAWLACDAVLGLVRRLPGPVDAGVRASAPVLRGSFAEDEARAAVCGTLRDLNLDAALRRKRPLESWTIAGVGPHAWPFWVGYRRGLFGWSLRAADAVTGEFADAGWRCVLRHGLAAGFAEPEPTSGAGLP